MYWFFIFIFSIIALFFMYLTIRRFMESEGEFALYNFIGFAFFSTIILLILFNIDYSFKEYEKICPDKAKIMHDDEECIIKYDGQRWETTEHSEYVNIVNNEFYIQKYKTFNVFGHDNGYLYEIKFSDEECFESIKL